MKKITFQDILLSTVSISVLTTDSDLVACGNCSRCSVGLSWALFMASQMVGLVISETFVCQAPGLHRFRQLG